MAKCVNMEKYIGVDQLEIPVIFKFNRPILAGTVLQTPLYLINKLTNPLPANLKNTFTPKP